MLLSHRSCNSIETTAFFVLVIPINYLIIAVCNYDFVRQKYKIIAHCQEQNEKTPELNSIAMELESKDIRCLYSYCGFFTPY